MRFKPKNGSDLLTSSLNLAPERSELIWAQRVRLSSFFGTEWRSYSISITQCTLPASCFQAAEAVQTTRVSLVVEIVRSHKNPKTSKSHWHPVYCQSVYCLNASGRSSWCATNHTKLFTVQGTMKMMMITRSSSTNCRLLKMPLKNGSLSLPLQIHLRINSLLIAQLNRFLGE